MASYLIMMSLRLLEMRRILADTGSIYLHVDPAACHYLKAVMDCIFGRTFFKNEIVWKYGKVRNPNANKFQRAHETLLFYVGPEATYNVLYDDMSPRKQQLVKAGYNTKNMNGERYIYIYDEETVKAKGIDLKAYDHLRRVDTRVGNRFTDVFEINILNSQSKENLGYPTQKPLALLARIIRASPNEGDMVLDPFCGCATTLVAAGRGSRRCPTEFGASNSGSGTAAAVRTERMMLTPSPGPPGNHLTEALSMWHPKGAGVASLRLFTIIGIRIRDHAGHASRAGVGRAGVNGNRGPVR